MMPHTLICPIFSWQPEKEEFFCILLRLRIKPAFIEHAWAQASQRIMSTDTAAWYAMMLDDAGYLEQKFVASRYFRKFFMRLYENPREYHTREKVSDVISRLWRHARKSHKHAMPKKMMDRKLEMIQQQFLPVP